MDKRLDRIVIKGLFNRFNYDIDLNNGDRVAILAAPNGCGKTTIFNILDFIFMPTIDKYIKITSFPFKECECFLSNGGKVTLTVKDMTEKIKDDSRLRMVYERLLRYYPELSDGFGTKVVTLKVKGKDSGKGTEVPVTKKIIELLSNQYMHGFDYDDEMDVPFEENNTRVRSLSISNFNFRNVIIATLFKEDCNIPIKFITADRLHNPEKTSTGKKLRRSERDGLGRKDPLQDACDEIKENYYTKMRDDFHDAQNKASESLPKKYLLAKKYENVSLDDFKQRWNHYTEDIRKFYEIGLLDSDESILSDDELEKAYEDKREFLNVYLEAFDETLNPLRKEYNRLKLFTDIINKRNKGTFKEIKYGRDGVKIIVEGDSEPLNINCLSSGEKHDFIMFYNLIFKTAPGSIVLIDEPEISWHINWQEEYIDRLLEICKINDLQAFIATHSPNIVNEHFDLMVDRG